MLVALIAWCGGCRQAETVTPLSSKESASSSLFRVQTNDVVLEEGNRGHAQLLVAPQSPWKFNDAYPTKLSLQPLNDQASIALMRTSFQEKDVRVVDGNVVVDVGLLGVRLGTELVAGTFNFSLCRQEQCILREQAVSWKVRVTQGPR
jgi:hypothetical protein